MTTKGYEEVSLLGTSRIPYPGSATVIVAAAGEGAAVRLVLSDHRWDEYQMHRNGSAIVLDRFIAHHSFFGVAEEHTYTCTGEVLPALTTPGAVSSGHCEGDGLLADMSVRVVGFDTTQAASRAVKTIHVRVEERLGGSITGTRDSDTWWDSTAGVPLRREVVTDFTTMTGFGETHYHEQLAVAAKE